MFRNTYQNGFLSILYSIGSKPLAIWDTQVQNGHVKRLTDGDIQSSVLEIMGTNVSTAFITAPADHAETLAIKLPFLVMIIKNLKKYFSFEVQILDDKGIRRRFRASNFQPFICTMPMKLDDGWNQIQFNLADFTKRAYGTNYVETLRVQVHANCRLRRIYFSDRLYAEHELPQEYKLFLPVPKECYLFSFSFHFFSDIMIPSPIDRSKRTLDLEVTRLERELDLIKTKSECKIGLLEENLERANLTCTKILSEKQKIQEELSLLQDGLIDQQTEIGILQAKVKHMDSELHRKDKDAKSLLAAARRYKSRVEYFRTKLRSRSNRRYSDEDSSVITGGVTDDDDGSILSSTIGGSNLGAPRRDSIPIPGYMTAEEEYFRLVVLAAKLNIAGTSTPSTFDGADSEEQSITEEVNEADIDSTRMYFQVQNDKVPFHKWHCWAEDYVVAHHMPPLMGVEAAPEENKRVSFSRKLLSGSKKTLKAFARLFSLKRKSSPIGIAA